jgi:hypothetical protein
MSEDEARAALGHEVPEKQDRLWWVAAAPGVWAAHFLLSYATAAVWCAKQGSDAPLSAARVAIAVFTVAGLVAVGAVGLRGWRSYRGTEAEPRTDIDTSLARHQFMGFTLLSLAGLSAVAIVYQALAAVFIGSCR